MIGFLKGEILEHAEGRVLLLAAGGGVGYSVAVPQSASYLGLMPGKTAELHVHTHVREDQLELFGFTTRVEKELFLTLLGVAGIGPKVAMAILSASEAGELIQAILDEDKEALTRIPGIGKKTAERVVLELSDKIRKKIELGALTARAGGVALASTGPLFKSIPGKGGARDIVDDAKAALVGLGYRENQVTTTLNRIVSESPTPPKAAEELVRTALRQLL